MEKIYKAGLIGCGDYLRWLIGSLNDSKRFKIKSTYDPDRAKRENLARQLSAKPVESEDALFDDKEIDIVLIFTPPWTRIELFTKAVASGKHIITTKPLANSLENAERIVKITGDRVNCAVHYGRTGNASVAAMKRIFASGEIGSLALYKEDWFHHYPTWNNWATDREKNGGPFMDAMIHNLNKARFLTGRKTESICYFSDNHAQTLKCNDTESMKINFAGEVSAHLFITWAADLEVFNPNANEREHYGISHFITKKGWYVQEIARDGNSYIRAHKDKEVKEWKVEPLPYTPYDEFVIHLEKGLEQDASLRMAYEDMLIMDAAIRKMNSTFKFEV
jgi:predicted dehydrogenase